MMTGCRTEFLALCRKVESLDRQHLEFDRLGPDWWPPETPEGERNWNNMAQTRFRLKVGYGYFGGALLTVTATRTNGTELWRRMADWPLEKAVDAFLSLTIPEGN